MRTPYGAECRHYYEDFARGRNLQECRLLTGSESETLWRPALCKDCPAPAIQRANACKDMQLDGRVIKTMLGLNRKMQIGAYCLKTKQAVNEPHVGCGQCEGTAVLADWLNQMK